MTEETGQRTNLYILARMLLSYTVFILMVMVFNRNQTDRFLSFAVVSISALTALGIQGYRLKQKLGFNLLRILVIGFIVKLVIGYLFWQFYLFPDYFTNPTSHIRFNHREYLYTEWLMKDIASERLSSGFFYVSPIILTFKHLKIHYLMSNLYMSGSYNPFDLAVQNSLFSMYTAVLVMAVARMLGATPRQLRFTTLLAVYQPLTMISSIIWRDTVGQFFVAFGGYLTFKAARSRFYIAFLLLLAGSFSMFMQRDIYFFFPLLVYTTYIIVQSKNKFLVLILPILFGIIFYLNFMFELSEGLITSYAGNLTLNSLGLFLPINIIRIFVGPFPWTQWFSFTDATIFQVADYFQSVLSIAMVLVCIRAFARHLIPDPIQNKGSYLLVIMFIPFILAALGTIDVHQAYMTTGIVFLIPVLALSTEGKSFSLYNFYVFVAFILVNLIWIVSGLAGSGFGSSFR